MSERAQKTAGKHARFHCPRVQLYQSATPQLRASRSASLDLRELRCPCAIVGVWSPSCRDHQRVIGDSIRAAFSGRNGTLFVPLPLGPVQRSDHLYFATSSPTTIFAATIVCAKGYASIYLLLDNLLCKLCVRDGLGYDSDLLSPAALLSHSWIECRALHILPQQVRGCFCSSDVHARLCSGAFNSIYQPRK